jgi:FkbM family methyltransferase
MKNLLNRFLKAYKEKGFFNLVLAIFTYPFRHFELYPVYMLLRRKITFKMGNVKILFTVNHLADAKGLNHTYSWERFILEFILRELKPKDIFWDVGANIGLYSLLASHSPKVNVIAFEPNPATVTLLKKNIEINRRTNIRILDVALSESDGSALFDTVKRNKPIVSAFLTNKETDSTIEVAIRRGDTLVESGDIPAPDILKLDVEGAEYLVVKGMCNAIKSCRLVICEVHSQISKYGGSKADFEKYLQDLGFKIEYKKNIPGYDTYHIIARHTN